MVAILIGVATVLIQTSATAGSLFNYVAILIGVATVLIAVLAIVVALRREREAFKARFPPLSDAEFVARCRPGTDPEVALKVRRIVAEHFGVNYESVYPSTTFIEDLGVD